VRVAQKPHPQKNHSYFQKLSFSMKNAFQEINWHVFLPDLFNTTFKPLKLCLCFISLNTVMKHGKLGVEVGTKMKR